MNEKAVSLMEPPEGYGKWLEELKARIHAARQWATLAVNRELILLYWQIETRLLERKGKAVTNFDTRLPKPQSDLAGIEQIEKELGGGHE